MRFFDIEKGASGILQAAVLSGVPELRYILVEEIVASLGRDRSDARMGQLRYLEDRYGLG